MLRPWTDEEIELASELASKGSTSTEIGKMLNRTRNSVIGKLHRKAVKLGERKPVARPKTSEPKPKKEHRQKNSDFLRSKAPNKPFAERVVTAKEGKPIPLMDARRSECKYIVSQDRERPFQTMCCGGWVHKNSSWCKEHYDIVFTPPKEKKNG